MKLQTTIKLSALIMVLALILSMPLFTSCDDSASQNIGDTTDALSTEATEDTAPSTETETPEPETTEAGFIIDESVDPLLAKIAKKMAESDNYLIFSIGDSLTEGQGASDAANLDYTAMFTKKLGEIFPEKTIYRVDGRRDNDTGTVKYPSPRLMQTGTDSSKITVVRSGFGGNTVKRIIARSTDFINRKIKGETGDLFIICSGINDSSMGNKDKYAKPPEYKQQLSDLIDMIYAAHPDADIILMTPTYVGNDGSTIAMHARYMRDLAKEREIALIDLNKLWMDHWVKGAPNFGQGDWLNTPPDGAKGDSCHPSDTGHEAIADEMIRCLFGIEAD